MLYPARRIVTGHNVQGRSIILSDGLATDLMTSAEHPLRCHVALADDIAVR
jgi:hypothetical protein